MRCTLLAAALTAACVASDPSASDPPLAEPPSDPAPEPAGGVQSAAGDVVQVNLLFIHGVQNDAGGKSRAHNALNDLRNAIANDMPSLIASYQASHPGVSIS